MPCPLSEGSLVGALHLLHKAGPLSFHLGRTLDQKRIELENNCDPLPAGKRMHNV